MDIKGKVLVGVAGWSYEDWKDVVYPAQEKNKLAHMTRLLDCIEINTSFYRPLSAWMAEKWLRDVSANEGFRFTAKLWSRFTHESEGPYPDAGEVAAVREGFRPLREAGKLVAVLVQFPFFFRDGPESRERLERIAGDFADYPKVVEVRDNSWAAPEALEFLGRLGLNVACLDMPWTRQSFRADAVVSGTIGYLRAHGRNYDAWFSKNAGRDEKYDYLYSDKELDSIVERVERLRQAAELVVLIWNNHFQGKAVANALQSVNRLLGTKVDVPPPMLESYPELKQIARGQDG